MKTQLRKAMNAMDQVFLDLVNMPILLKIFVILTVGVFTVPIKYLVSPITYSNAKLAAPFIESLPIFNNMLLATHIAFALPAIIFGPFLLYTPFRLRWPHIHRLLGKFYVAGCLMSAILVIPLALNNRITHEGYPGQIAYEGRVGFTVMACLWFTVTYLAYTAAINKDFVAHRRWMIRSYAMTFAFIHVNVTLYHFLPHHLLSLGASKVFQSMVSWMFNLFMAELYLGATNHHGKFLGFKKWGRTLFTPSKLDRRYWKPVPKAKASPRPK